VVSDPKLSGYLLSQTHAVGRFKARFLMSHGFHPNKPDAVRQALLAHLSISTVSVTQDTEFGTKYVVLGRLPTPDGRDPLVRSVWFEPPGGDAVNLVTVYPVKGTT
jgi:hypothetical protein